MSGQGLLRGGCSAQVALTDSLHFSSPFHSGRAVPRSSHGFGEGISVGARRGKYRHSFHSCKANGKKWLRLILDNSLRGGRVGLLPTHPTRIPDASATRRTRKVFP